MRKLFALIGMLALAATMGFGQTTNRFSLSGNALGYIASGTKLAAADAVALIKFDANSPYTLRNDNIIISGGSANANLAVFNLAGVQADLPVSKVLTSLKLDPSKVSVYAFGEGGSVTSANGTTQAFSGGLGAEYQVSPSVSVTVFEVRYLRGEVPIGAVGGTPNYAQNGVALSVGFSFGK